ncbi:MAG: oligosaccharide flippase family protein [Taibaiella sp.]|nr:oligosaccharide flippase family protein [Taibaiella sp.]
MRRFFVKNILFIVAVNVLVKPIWVFFIDRTVQNRVGQEAYGSYAPLLNWCIIFQIILDFGLTSYNSRTIAQNPDKLTDLFPTMLSARMVLMVLYAGIVYLGGYIIGYRGWMLVLLSGILLIQGLNMLLQFIRSNVAALHRFKTDGLLSISDRLLMIIVCGFLLYYPATAHRFKIEWFIMAQIGCYFIACIIALYVLRRIHPIRMRMSFHLPDILAIIKQSLPYALLTFLMSIYIRADSTMIERLCGSEGKAEAGLYAHSYRLLDVSNMFGLMFATMLLPLFGRMLIQKQNIQAIVRLCVDLLLPVSLMLAVASVFFGSPIMHLLYPAATGRDSLIFGWLMASFPAWCMIYIYTTLLTANGNLKLMNRIAGAAVAITLILNFYLIPRQQALGAAITTFITETFVAVAAIIVCTKVFHLAKNVKWMGAHAGFLLLIIGVAYLVTYKPYNWMVQMAVFGAICITLMFIFRFISIKAIRQFAKKGS